MSHEAQQLATNSEGEPYPTGHRWHGLTWGGVVDTFLRQAGLAEATEDSTLQLKYRMSKKGAMMFVAGYIQHSRVYSIGPDPFKLPRKLRAIALGKFGWDFDDAASFPRACAFCVETGREICEDFLRHREEILMAIGRHFLPAAAPKEQREAAKLLTNRLDMDGSFSQWCEDVRVPPSRR